MSGTFEDFFRDVDDMARGIYDEDVKIPLTILFEDAGGSRYLVAMDHSPAGDRSRLTMLQMFAVAVDAVWYGFAMDAWYFDTRRNGGKDPKADADLMAERIKVREHPHHTEAVVAMAYRRGVGIPSINTYHVTRGEGGARTLSLETLEEGDKLHNLCSDWGDRVLPPFAPPEELRALARMGLALRGIDVEAVRSRAKRGESSAPRRSPPP